MILAWSTAVAVDVAKGELLQCITVIKGQLTLSTDITAEYA